jgi:hypothetical protein
MAETKNSHMSGLNTLAAPKKMLSPVAIAYRAISSRTTACSVTPIRNNQRISGPKTRTSRGQR